MSIRHGALGLGILGRPLLRTGGARRQLPVVLVQVVQEPVVPLRRLVGPCALEPAGDRVGALAAAEGVLPAEALLLEAGALWFGTDVLGAGAAPWALPNVWPPTMSASGLLVIHRHAAERFSNVLRCKGRIRVAARPLRIHVDQAHVIGAERPLDLPVAGVALVSEPGVLGAPEDLVGLPDVSRPKPKPNVLNPIDS